MCLGARASGAKVALCARNQEKLEQLAGEINGNGGEAAAFKIDVGNEDEIKSGVKASSPSSARSTSWSTTPASRATNWSCA